MMTPDELKRLEIRTQRKAYLTRRQQMKRSAKRTEMYRARYKNDRWGI